jgi:hypothetical protein
MPTFFWRNHRRLRAGSEYGVSNCRNHALFVLFCCLGNPLLSSFTPRPSSSIFFFFLFFFYFAYFLLLLLLHLLHLPEPLLSFKCLSFNLPMFETEKKVNN